MLINIVLRCLTFVHIYQKLPRMGAEQVPLHDTAFCWPPSPHPEATLQQLQRLQLAGAEIGRLAVPTQAAADALYFRSLS